MACIVITCVALLSLPAAASHSQIEKKARELANLKKKQELLNVAREIGAHIANVRVKFEQSGETVKLSGYVPHSNDLIRILLAAEAVGPFNEVRNYIKVEVPTAPDGIIMRAVHYEYVSPPDGAEPSGEDKECIKSCEEYNRLNKEIKQLVLRKHDEHSNVYQPSAKSLIDRMLEIQDQLDGSMCFKRVENQPSEQ